MAAIIIDSRAATKVGPPITWQLLALAALMLLMLLMRLMLLLMDCGR
jgi:hypothetical protein